jgi:butyrate kinase
MKILVINPGSTSTKVSLFDDDTLLFEESEFHDAPVLLQYTSVNDQVPFRKQVVLNILKQKGFTLKDVDVFVGRG